MESKIDDLCEVVEALHREELKFIESMAMTGISIGLSQMVEPSVHFN